VNLAGGRELTVPTSIHLENHLEEQLFPTVLGAGIQINKTKKVLLPAIAYSLGCWLLRHAQQAQFFSLIVREH
jgi:hypothetical protein